MSQSSYMLEKRFLRHLQIAVDHWKVSKLWTESSLQCARDVLRMCGTTHGS